MSFVVDVVVVVEVVDDDDDKRSIALDLVLVRAKKNWENFCPASMTSHMGVSVLRTSLRRPPFSLINVCVGVGVDG